MRVAHWQRRQAGRAPGSIPGKTFSTSRPRALEGKLREKPWRKAVSAKSGIFSPPASSFRTSFGGAGSAPAASVSAASARAAVKAATGMPILISSRSSTANGTTGSYRERAFFVKIDS
jgi:hypothetical protein